MWAHLALLLLVGTSLADPIWKQNQVYHYAIQSRSLTGVQASNQISGVLIKSILKISVPQEDYLMVELTDKKYAPIHKRIESDWDAPVSMKEEDFTNLSVPPNVLKFKLRNGLIDEVLAPQDMETSMVNFVKGIMSQLQLKMDERKMKSLSNEPYQTYKTREQTVASYCDTVYNIAPMQKKSELGHLIKILNKQDNKKLFEVTKYRDYQNCVQEANYFHMITEHPNEEIRQNYFKRLSTSNLVLSLTQDSLTIVSSKMKNIMDVRPKVKDMESLTVYSSMDARLVKLRTLQENFNEQTHLRLVGNLSYVYDPKDVSSWEDEVLFTKGTKEHMNSRTSIEKSRELDEMSPVQESRHSESSEEDVSKYNNRMHRFMLRKREALSLGRHRSAMKDQKPTKSHLIDEAVSLIHEISTEIQKPDDLMRQHTLEKFTILVKVFRHFDMTDITTIEDKMQLTHKLVHLQKDEAKLGSWRVLRDAVVQTGSQDGFNMIRKWIQQKMIRDIEAADVISKLPRVVLQPTPEYIEQLFEFIKLPEVKDQMFLNTTAPYVFSELLRYSMVYDQKYIYSKPNMPAGIKASEKKKVVDVYIPYFAKELEKAYRIKHNSAIVKYIVVLGNIGHPKVISVFEPYLEGKHTLTTFQRTVMVSSLRNIKPEAQEPVKEIAYRIYQNENESYEVRVMAVNVLLRCNPSLRLLRLLAEKAVNEVDPEVRNVIVTGIDSLSKLDSPKYKVLANNANIAKRYLKLDERIEKSSYMIFKDYVNKHRDLSSWLNVESTGTRNNIPKMIELQYGTNFSYLSPPSTKMNLGASDINTFLDVIKKLVYQLSGYKQESKVDEVVEKLSIVNNNAVVPEAAIILSDAYRTSLYIFDQEMVQSLLNSNEQMLDKNKIEINKSFDMQSISVWNFLLSVSTELGIPVQYRIQKPVLSVFKSQLSVKQKQSEIKVELDADMIWCEKKINRLAVMTPFSSEKYFAGADSDMYLRNMPGKLIMKLDYEKKLIGILHVMEPSTRKMTMLQLNYLPYTGRANYVDMRPVQTLDNTHPVVIGQLRKSTKSFGNMKFMMETDDYLDEANNRQKFDLFNILMDSLYGYSFHYKKLKMSLNDDMMQDDSTSTINNYNHILSKNNEKKPSDDIDSAIKEHMDTNQYRDKDITMSILIKYDKVLLASNLEKNGDNENSALRKHMNKLEDTDTLSNAHSWDKLDITFKRPGQDKHYQCAVGLVESKDHLFHRLYFNCKEPSGSEMLDAEAEIISRPSGCPSLDVYSEKMRELKASITYGIEGEAQKQIRIEGIQKQSDIEKERIKDSDLYHESIRERERGNMGSINMDELCKVINHMDQNTLTIKLGPQNVEILNWLAVKSARFLPDFNLDLIQSWSKSNVASDIVNLEITKPHDSDVVNLTLASKTLFMQLPLKMYSLLPEQSVDWFYGIKSDHKLCKIGSTKVNTFDNTEYDIARSKYPRVLLINPTRPNLNLGSLSHVSAMPDLYHIAIVSQDINERQRQLTVIYRNLLYKINPPTDYSNDDRLLINDREFRFDGGDTILVEADPVIKIIKIQPQTFRILIEQAEISILYKNYETLEIEASDNYNGNIRGLCGSKSGNPQKELVAPSGCILSKPEHLAALYTWRNGPWDEDMKRLKQEAEAAECHKVEHREINLFTTNPHQHSYLADRTPKCTTFKTMVRKDKSGRICFSTRPLPVCEDGCLSEGKVQKNIDHYCETDGPEIRELVEKVEQGARPDFSMKSEIFPLITDIPSRCRPLY